MSLWVWVTVFSFGGWLLEGSGKEFWPGVPPTQIWVQTHTPSRWESASVGGCHSLPAVHVRGTCVPVETGGMTQGATCRQAENQALVSPARRTSLQRRDRLPMRAEPVRMSEHMCPVKGARQKGACGRRVLPFF